MADPGQRKFKPSDLIDLADRRSERRGKTLDLKRELLLSTQELCQERRWHWRKKSIAFQTESGKPVYDLSETDDMKGLTVERVCGGYVKGHWQGPKIFRSPAEGSDLTPIFETDTQELVRESSDAGMPGQYFMDGQDQFRVAPTPDGIYTVRVPAWVLPDDSPMEDEITLVPAYLYSLLVKKLEAQIFRFTLGEGNAKYVAAQAEYDRALQRASLNTDFAEGRVKEWTSDEEAIQSS